MLRVLLIMERLFFPAGRQFLDIEPITCKLQFPTNSLALQVTILAQVAENPDSPCTAEPVVTVQASGPESDHSDLLFHCVEATTSLLWTFPFVPSVS